MEPLSKIGVSSPNYLPSKDERHIFFLRAGLNEIIDCYRYELRPLQVCVNLAGFFDLAGFLNLAGHLDLSGHLEK